MYIYICVHRDVADFRDVANFATLLIFSKLPIFTCIYTYIYNRDVVVFHIYLHIYIYIIVRLPIFL